MTIQIPELPGYLSSNPLVDLFSDAQLIQYNQMISAVLTACAVKCELTFGNCKWVDCVDCLGGLYGPGGAELSSKCSVCKGTKQVAVDETLELCMAVEWDSSKFEKYADVDMANVGVQIKTHMEYCSLLKGMQYIKLDTCNKCCDDKKYKIVGHPIPCGFGRKKSFLTVFLESF